MQQSCLHGRHRQSVHTAQILVQIFPGLSSRWLPWIFDFQMERLVTALSLSLILSLILSLTHSLSLACCCDGIYGLQDIKLYSHADSLSLYICI